MNNKNIYIHILSTNTRIWNTKICSLTQDITGCQRRCQPLVSTSSGAKIGGKFTGQFLQNGWTKINPLTAVCSTAWDTHHIKKWAQSVQCSRSYSKNKVPYQLTPEERYATFRAKTDLLNYGKRPIKHIWAES